MTLEVRLATQEDLADVAEMFAQLWPDATVEEHTRDLAPVIAGRPGALPAVTFIATESGRAIGFLQAGLRSHADGCDPSHSVGFIEGWDVWPEHRRRGIGTKLVVAAEAWARQLGCVEMASDTWAGHLESQRAHEALGFQVVDRCVHYRKQLT